VRAEFLADPLHHDRPCVCVRHGGGHRTARWRRQGIEKRSMVRTRMSAGDPQQGVNDDADDESRHLQQTAGLSDEVPDAQAVPLVSANTRATTEIPAAKRQPVQNRRERSGMITCRTSRHPRSPTCGLPSTTRRSTLRTPFDAFRYIGVSVARVMNNTFSFLTDAEPDE